VDELANFFKGLNLPVSVEHRDIGRPEEASTR
jgi:hypothetical protein